MYASSWWPGAAARFVVAFDQLVADSTGAVGVDAECAHTE